MTLNQINDETTRSKEIKDITNKEQNDKWSFPTPDILDNNGEIDKKKVEEKASKTVEEAAKEKDSAEKENKPNVFKKIGAFFSGIFNKSPENRTEADKYAAKKYEETKKQLSDESNKTSLPESYASNNSNNNEMDKK